MQELQQAVNDPCLFPICSSLHASFVCSVPIRFKKTKLRRNVFISNSLKIVYVRRHLNERVFSYAFYVSNFKQAIYYLLIQRSSVFFLTCTYIRISSAVHTNNLKFLHKRNTMLQHSQKIVYLYMLSLKSVVLDWKSCLKECLLVITRREY